MKVLVSTIDGRGHILHEEEGHLEEFEEQLNEFGR